ncbi:hypothetical protein B0H66DRAFT_527806 [Apodospora peruviana]|uniref:Uncharacterized protein n=1 Tax=Apodospora peruviana TaxID=516989 RepID=A0AAE0MFA9_9PEZI|nr:hypothetical protein B0H66DRAFT_527806 [Apodospora peruviana]
MFRKAAIVAGGVCLGALVCSFPFAATFSYLASKSEKEPNSNEGDSETTLVASQSGQTTELMPCPISQPATNIEKFLTRKCEKPIISQDPLYDNNNHADDWNEDDDEDDDGLSFTSVNEPGPRTKIITPFSSPVIDTLLVSHKKKPEPTTNYAKPEPEDGKTKTSAVIFNLVNDDVKDLNVSNMSIVLHSKYLLGCCCSTPCRRRHGDEDGSLGSRLANNHPQPRRRSHRRRNGLYQSHLQDQPWPRPTPNWSQSTPAQAGMTRRRARVVGRKAASWGRIVTAGFYEEWKANEWERLKTEYVRTEKRLEDFKWNEYFFVDDKGGGQLGFCEVDRDEAFAHEGLIISKCQWSRFKAMPKNRRLHFAPELKLTTPGGQEFWLDDRTVYPKLLRDDYERWRWMISYGP